MKKGFTLVELLIVVAILGILAAVGVVSYTGFLGSAKENATKANHKNIVSYMQAEVTKCSLGDSTLNLVDSGGSPSPWGCNSGSSTDDYVSRFVAHFQGSFKNPYNAESQAAENSICPSELGRTGISKTDENTISVQTRYVDGENCVTAQVGVE